MSVAGQPSGEAAAELIANLHAEAARRQRSDGGIRLTPLAVVLGLLSIILLLVVVVLAFSVVINRQHTIDDLRAQIDTDAELDRCHALMASDVAVAQQNSIDASNDVLALLAAQFVSIDPPDLRRFADALSQRAVADARYHEAVEFRADWIREGSALPCPIES
jgi:hypothetical protein